VPCSKCSQLGFIGQGGALWGRQDSAELSWIG
jgi:hypothetical protein